MLKEPSAVLALAGHSTNLPKLYRYAAFTSYSVGFDCWAYRTGAAITAQATATATNRDRRAGDVPDTHRAGVHWKGSIPTTFFPPISAPVAKLSLRRPLA